MRKIINKILIISVTILMSFLLACSKPVVVILDDINDVPLNNWVSVEIINEDDSDFIDHLEASLNGEHVLITYTIKDSQTVDFKSDYRLKPEAQYELEIILKSKKVYKLNLNTITSLEQEIKDAKENFFIMPIQGDYDKVEANKMKQRILSISPKILLSLYRTNVRMKLTNAPITEEPELQNLRGVTPRGWEGTGMTWEDVPGAGGYDLPIARIGYSEPSFESNHSTINLELHELAHTVDNYITGEFSDPLSFSDEFISIWNAEVYGILDSAYFTNYVDEYFAEAFAMYYLDDDSRLELETYAPTTHKYMENLENYTNIKGLD